MCPHHDGFSGSHSFNGSIKVKNGNIIICAVNGHHQTIVFVIWLLYTYCFNYDVYSSKYVFL